MKRKIIAVIIIVVLLLVIFWPKKYNIGVQVVPFWASGVPTKVCKCYGFSKSIGPIEQNEFICFGIPECREVSGYNIPVTVPASAS